MGLTSLLEMPDIGLKILEQLSTQDLIRLSHANKACRQIILSSSDVIWEKTWKHCHTTSIWASCLPPKAFIFKSKDGVQAEVLEPSEMYQMSIRRYLLSRLTDIKYEMGEVVNDKTIEWMECCAIKQRIYYSVGSELWYYDIKQATSTCLCENIGSNNYANVDGLLVGKDYLVLYAARSGESTTETTNSSTMLVFYQDNLLCRRNDVGQLDCNWSKNHVSTSQCLLRCNQDSVLYCRNDNVFLFRLSTQEERVIPSPSSIGSMKNKVLWFTSHNCPETGRLHHSAIIYQLQTSVINLMELQVDCSNPQTSTIIKVSEIETGAVMHAFCLPQSDTLFSITPFFPVTLFHADAVLPSITSAALIFDSASSFTVARVFRRNFVESNVLLEPIENTASDVFLSMTQNSAQRPSLQVACRGNLYLYKPYKSRVQSGHLIHDPPHQNCLSLRFLRAHGYDLDWFAWSFDGLFLYFATRLGGTVFCYNPAIGHAVSSIKISEQGYQVKEIYLVRYTVVVFLERDIKESSLSSGAEVIRIRDHRIRIYNICNFNSM